MTPITQAPFAAIQAAASDGRCKAILYMPAGRWQITPWIGGQPAPLDVLVEPSAAEAIEQQRRIQAGGGARAFFSPSHQSSQPWFEVDGFAWETRADKTGQPHTGIWASGNYTEAGTRGMAAQVFPYFSPEFFVDNLAGKPARVVTNPKARPNMGGFVDQPAFPMPPVQASGADTSAPAAAGSVSSSNPSKQPTNPNTDPMKKSWLLLDPNPSAGGGGAAAAPVQAASAPAALPNPPAPVPAASAPELAELTTLRAEKQASLEREADAAVAVCAAKGIIPPKDEAAKVAWRKSFLTDPALAARMTALPSALPPGRVVQAGRAEVSITRDDMRHVVQAYHASQSPQERGAIWASGLRGRLGNEWDGMIQAANSLGSISGNLIVQRSLDLLKYEFPLLTRISTDFTSENAAKGQAIITRLRAVPAATDYDGTTGYADSDAATTDVSVTIDQHKAVQVSFNANELGSTRRLLFPEQEEGMHYALGQTLVDALYALLTAANYANTTTKALGSFNRAAVIGMKTALNTRKVLGGSRTLLLNSDYHGALEEDTSIVSALINAGAAGAIATSVLPPIAKFQVIEAGNLPTTGNLTGFGFRADALAMATRLPNDYTQALPGVPATGAVSVITNPDTGISVLLTQFVDHQLGKSTARVALMYGVAKGQVASGQRLVSA